MIQTLLRSLVQGQPLADDSLHEVLCLAMRGEAEPVALAGLLAALACRPPESSWLVAGARALRAHGVAIRPQVRPLVDTCGTGGDGAGTFNVSTATAFVVAGAGCAVAKHGNRAVSSSVGSADVLAAAGCRLEHAPERARQLLDATGFVFLFAPNHHPAMRHVAPVRRALGVRTLFNLLGPLVNPAHAEVQLLGVYDRSCTEAMATALRELGSRRALVVHCDGLDEIGLHAPTEGHLLDGGRISPIRLEPADFGLERAPIEALRGASDPARAARELVGTLDGDDGARSDVVVANAAAALWLAGRVPDLRDGARLARDTMRSGMARRALARYAESSCHAEVA